MNWPIATMSLRGDEYVVAARRLAREISAALNFDLQDQTRIATTVSEISRNAVAYAGGGQIDFALDGDMRPQILRVTVRIRGRHLRPGRRLCRQVPLSKRHGQWNCRRAPADGRILH